MAATETASINVRVSPGFKSDLQMAADLEGMGLKEYLVRKLKPSIQKTLQSERIWELNEADSIRLANALAGKGRDIPALREAMSQHKHAVK